MKQKKNESSEFEIDDREEYVTETGKIITGAEMDAFAEEFATTDIDLSKLKPRGRPLLGLAPSKVLQVRLDPELALKLNERAETENTTKSEIMRQALTRYLAS